MESQVTDLTSFLVEYKEELGAILGVPLLFSAKYLRKKYRNIFRCKRPIPGCKLKDLHEIMKSVDRYMVEIIVEVSNTYDEDLEELLQREKHNYTTEYVESCKKMYRNVVEISFAVGREEFYRMFYENHLPKKNTSSYVKMIDDRFSYIYDLIWREFDRRYSSVFIITIDNRREKMLEGRQRMKELFFVPTIEYWYELREAA